MAISSSPVPIFHSARNQGIHRSFTLPSRLSDSPTPSPTNKSTDSIEILFESPKCKIVSFSPQEPTGRPRAASVDVDITSQTAEELPYGTATERTLALGPLRVYRVPSSVAFLNSGKLVHAVLPKSACWCVDGKTKFVLGVPGKKYYRIELPCEDEADQTKADEFKVVLAKIAQYETIRCPFKRGFYVDLPESNENTPKRPWRPKHSPGMTSPWSPEGQHMVDEPRIERSFHSPVRESSPSLRKAYRPIKDTLEVSDNESTSDAGVGKAATTAGKEPRVPQLVATYDEYGPGQIQATASPMLEAKIANDATTETVSNHVQSESPAENVHTMGFDLQDSNTIRTPEDSHASKIGVLEDSKSEKIELSTNVGVGLEETPNTITKSSLGNESSSPSSQLKGDMENLNWLDDNENDETPMATRPSSGLRSFTAPVFSSLQPDITQPIQVLNVENPSDKFETESLTSAGSTTSFHSLHSPNSPVQIVDTLGIITIPSLKLGADLDTNLKILKRETSTIITNNVTENMPPPNSSVPNWASSSPLSEDAADDDTEASTESDSKSFATAASPPLPSSSSPTISERQPRPKSPSASLRAHLRSRRTHSPMPQPANIYIPPASLSGHLTNVILNKTASILLGPPVQLVALMLNLARRFRDGSLKGQTYTYGSHGQPIPCEWGDSDLDVDGNSSEEDDYGISIGGTPEKSSRERHSRRRASKRDGSWDLD